MSALQPYQQRVMQELHELRDRLIKLNMFIDSPEFVRVSDAEQSLLREQASHMINYHRTLLTRVDAWGKPQEPTT